MPPVPTVIMNRPIRVHNLRKKKAIDESLHQSISVNTNRNIAHIHQVYLCYCLDQIEKLNLLSNNRKVIIVVTNHFPNEIKIEVAFVAVFSQRSTVSGCGTSSFLSLNHK